MMTLNETNQQKGLEGQYEDGLKAGGLYCEWLDRRMNKELMFSHVLPPKM